MRTLLIVSSRPHNTVVPLALEILLGSPEFAIECKGVTEPPVAHLLYSGKPLPPYPAVADLALMEMSERTIESSCDWTDYFQAKRLASSLHFAAQRE